MTLIANWTDMLVRNELLERGWPNKTSPGVGSTAAASSTSQLVTCGCTHSRDRDGRRLHYRSSIMEASARRIPDVGYEADETACLYGSAVAGHQ